MPDASGPPPFDAAAPAAAVSAAAPKQSSAPAWMRFAPIAALALGAALLIWMFGDLLSFETLAASRDDLFAWRDQNYALAAAVFLLAYMAVVAFSIPGALWMTLTGGFLFGLVGGATLNVLGATLGATAIFLAARTGLGEPLRARAGPWLSKFERGLKENEISYLLLLRLVPAVPFFIANLAPAFLGVRTVTYVWTTFLGIIPGAAVYTSVGVGLGEAIAEGAAPDTSLATVFGDPFVWGPLVGLILLSLLPIAIKALRGRRAAPVE